MTKKQYETNNRLNNVEMALMNKRLPENERLRLRQIQAQLKANLKGGN